MTSEGIGGFLPPVVAKLVADISGFKAGMADARSEMDKTAAAHQKLAQTAKVAGGLIVAAAVPVAVAAVHMADAYEEAHARFQNAVKNTGGTLRTFQGQIDAVERKLTSLGFSNTEAESALATLTRASGSTTKALRDIALAADIARARNISLQSATDLLAKVETGHVALLGRYGIATKDAAGKTLSVEQALVSLSQKFGGQARQSAETFAGKLQVVRAEVTNLGTKLGQFLIPIIEQVIAKIIDIVNWFEKHRAVAVALAIAVGTVLTAAFLAWAAAAAVAAANTVIAMAPVIVAVGAITLAAYDGVQAWSRWGNSIKDAINNTVIPALNGLIDVYNSTIGQIPGVDQIGHIGNLDTGGGSSGAGVAQYSGPIGPGLSGAHSNIQYAGPIGPGLPNPGSYVPPSYDEGGVVPGPRGAPQWAIVYGGEEVITASQRGRGGVTINVNGSIVGSNPRDIARWLQNMLMAGARGGVGNGYAQVTGTSAG